MNHADLDSSKRKSCEEFRKLSSKRRIDAAHKTNIGEFHQQSDL